jgi:hypothetical protein
VVFNSGKTLQRQIAFRLPSQGEWRIAFNTHDNKYANLTSQKWNNLIFNGQNFGIHGFTPSHRRGNPLNGTGAKLKTFTGGNGILYGKRDLPPYSAIVFTKIKHASVKLDGNSNGLPDAWETLTGIRDPKGDDDGDGIRNSREFKESLDPKVFNPDSVVGDFNGWDVLSSPLIPSDGNIAQRGHWQFFPSANTGNFSWLLKGSRSLRSGYRAEPKTYLFFRSSGKFRAVIPIDTKNPADSNANGLDDNWETHYGINTAIGDEDQDGLSNGVEFLQGTNPKLANPRPALVGNRLPLAWSPDDPNLKMTWSYDRDRWEWVGEFSRGRLEFKFAMGPGWAGDNHGISSTPGKTDLAGGNIVRDFESAGRYRFSFSDVRSEFSIERLMPSIALRENSRSPLGKSAEISVAEVLVHESSNPRTLTIQNNGNDELTGLTVLLSGSHAADFSVSSLGATALAPGNSTTLNVTFRPSSAGRSAVQLVIAGSDPAHTPLVIPLSGYGISSSLDFDGDGMNDAAEHHMAGFGFDWKIPQSEMSAAYLASVNAGGLYTQNQIHGMNLGNPLISKNAETGNFELTVGMQKSTDLHSFEDFSLENSETTIEPDGRLKIRFTVPDNAAFFRLQAD